MNLSNDIIIQKENKGIKYLQFRKLLEYSDKLEHGISMKPMNFMPADSNFENKISKFCDVLNIEGLTEKVVWAHQRHTANILSVDKQFLNYGNFDKKIFESMVEEEKRTEKSRPEEATNSENKYGVKNENQIKNEGEHEEKKENKIQRNEEGKESKVLKVAPDFADGFITQTPNITILTREADCIPILIYDKRKNIIANVHSGWRGTLNKIALVAISKMQIEYGSKLEDIIVAIGPSIRKCHFEIEDDVLNLFKSKFDNINDFYENKVLQDKSLKGYSDEHNENSKRDYKEQNENINGHHNAQRKNKYMLDTIELLKNYLISYGIKEENILDSKICTYCNKDEFHSFRGSKGLKKNNAIFAMLK